MTKFERPELIFDMAICVDCGAVVASHREAEHSTFHFGVADTEARLNHVIKWVKNAFIELGKVFGA